jgi:hypothetical protein
MADSADINRQDQNHDSASSVTDSILALRNKIDSSELPGLPDLIDDWFDPKVDVNEEQFVRRFLQAFKKSDKDFTYEKIVGDYDDEVRDIFNDFVDGKINAHEAGQKYRPYTTAKLPRHKGALRKGGLASTIPGQDNDGLKEETSLLVALPSSIPSRIRSLVAKVLPATKNPKRALYIPVSASRSPSKSDPAH